MDEHFVTFDNDKNQLARHGTSKMGNQVTFIGAGNMASAIFGGLINSGFAASNITAAAPDQPELERLNALYGVRTETDNAIAVADADVVVLAVKPQIMKAVCEPLRAVIQARSKPPLILSVAAGIEAETLSNWLGGDLAVVRAMPNTPALVGAGATGLFANAAVDVDQRSLAGRLLGAVGHVEWVEQESLLDAVTAVSGSGPAYFFLIFSAMEDAGVSLGLSREAARRLALETGFGAAKMALDSADEPAQLMRNVMSPQGSTERAIATFEDRELRQIFQEAMEACAQRAREMQSEFGC